MTPPIRVSTQIGAASHEAWEVAHSRNDNGENQTIKNVLIWESEDLGPIGNRFQQQTVDQEHNDVTLSTTELSTPVPQITTADHVDDQSLLQLEPPLTSSEYSFSLDEQENLNDLFDSFPF